MTCEYIVCGHTNLVNVALQQLKDKLPAAESGYLPLCDTRPEIGSNVRVFSFPEVLEKVNSGKCMVMIACPQYYEAMKYLAGNGIAKDYIEIHPLSFFM